MDNNQLTAKADAHCNNIPSDNAHWDEGGGYREHVLTDVYEAAYKQALQDVQAQIAALTKQEAGGESAKRRIASYNYALNQVLSPFQELL